MALTYAAVTRFMSLCRLLQKGLLHGRSDCRTSRVAYAQIKLARCWRLKAADSGLASLLETSSAILAISSCSAPTPLFSITYKSKLHPSQVQEHGSRSSIITNIREGLKGLLAPCTGGLLRPRQCWRCSGARTARGWLWRGPPERAGNPGMAALPALHMPSRNWPAHHSTPAESSRPG